MFLFRTSLCLSICVFTVVRSSSGSVDSVDLDKITDLTASLPVRSCSVPENEEWKSNGNRRPSHESTSSSSGEETDGNSIGVSRPVMRGNRWVWSYEGIYQWLYFFICMVPFLFPLLFSLTFFSMEPAIYNTRSPVRKRSASFRKISKHKKLEGRNSEMVRISMTNRTEICLWENDPQIKCGFIYSC